MSLNFDNFRPVLLITLIVFSSCSVNKHLQKSEHTVNKDSTSVVQMFRQAETLITENIDTVVVIPPDSFAFDVVDFIPQSFETDNLTVTFDSSKDGKRKLRIVEKPRKVTVKLNRVSQVKSSEHSEQK